MNRWTCPLCRMHCLVTAGATYEPIDEVRRLTNHSTGRLGCALADALQRAGHRVTLLLSETAQHNPRSRKVRVLRFNTTHSLQRQMKEAEALKVKAIFHVAAVSDFSIARPRRGKFSSAEKLTLTLKPTLKIIRQLRRWHPNALVIGWKYEVSGKLKQAINKGLEQMKNCQTDACVVNGPAYGEGFGLVRKEAEHCPNERALFRRLLTLLQ